MLLPSTLDETDKRKGIGGTDIGSVDVSDEYLLPVCSDNQDHIRRDYNGYSICYRESYEQTEWAATCLTREKVNKKFLLALIILRRPKNCNRFINFSRL